MKKLLPLNNRILAKRLDETESTPGGILLPNMSQEKSNLATVVKTASEVQGIVEGETVMFIDHYAVEIKIDGQDFVLLDRDHLLGVFYED